MAPPLPSVPACIKLTNSFSSGVVVDLFHDVCCPYSKKMFDTVFRSLIPTLETKNLIGGIQFLWQSVPQPWHAQSCCMHDAIMAASILDVEKTPTYISNIFAKQTDFFDDQAKNLSRVQIYEKLATIGGESGYDISSLSALLSLEDVRGNEGLGNVTQYLKWAVKYHRVRGVHVTPTVFINGIEAPDVSSGWCDTEWLEKLQPMITEN